jgi:nucleotide-binding universal stress UspA family protein
LGVVDVKDLMAMYQATATSNYTLSTGLDVTQYVSEWEKHAESVKQEAASHLENFQGNYEWHVVEADDRPGGPAAALNAFAVEWNADGIVVGRHQGSTILEGVFGSFPRWLVTHSSLPVVVVPLQ